MKKKKKKSVVTAVFTLNVNICAVLLTKDPITIIQ